MTDLRELLDSALGDEPASTIDPYAAMAAGRARRRGRRHRWLAGGAAAVVVLGAGAAVTLPRLGSSAGTGPATTPTTSRAPATWTVTEPAVANSFALDVPRTLANLDGAAGDVQRLLGLDAVAAAEPYRVDSAPYQAYAELGVLQLAYSAAGDVEVHVVLAGSLTASAAASCARSDPVPPPQHWPAPTSGKRPLGSRICVNGPTVVTTWAGQGRLDRTVTADAEPLYRGAVSVTVTSDAAVPAPTTVAAAAAVVEALRPLVAFGNEPVSELGEPVEPMSLEQTLCMPESKYAVVLEAYLTTVGKVRRHTSGLGARPAAGPWAGLPADGPAAWCVVQEGEKYRIVAATADGPTVGFVTSASPLSTDEKGPVVP